MAAAVVAIVVAVIAAAASVGSAITVEVSRRRSVAALEREKHDRDAAAVMATYRLPLTRATYDLQSRLWNIWSGFRGRRDPDYFRHNTLFVLAEFLGWLEIVRQEVQFLDVGDEGGTRELQKRIADVRDRLAETSEAAGAGDSFYVYRGEQRAIGELMIVTNTARAGPARSCRGYASFVAEIETDESKRWFERIGREVDALKAHVPRRIVGLQHALVDLLDALDPDHVRVTEKRGKILG